MLKQHTETVAQSCSVKRLSVSQNPQENICAIVSFAIKLQVASFSRLCVPRMITNLNINDNKRKRGFGKKEIFEGNKCFICKTLSIKEFLNFLAGQRIMPKISQFF